MSEDSPQPDKRAAIEAYADQGITRYPGTDMWEPTTIPKGTRLAQFDYDPDRKDSNRTASRYFTTEAEAKDLLDKESGTIDAKALADRVQVMAFRRDPNETFSYNPQVTIYETDKPIPAAVSVVENNRQHGEGKAIQYYALPDNYALINEEYMRPVEVYNTHNRAADEQLYKDIDRGLNEGRIHPLDVEQDVIGKAYKESKLALLRSGSDEAMAQVLDMGETERFSKVAKEITKDQLWPKADKLALPKAQTIDQHIAKLEGKLKSPQARDQLAQIMESRKRNALLTNRAAPQASRPDPQTQRADIELGD